MKIGTITVHNGYNYGASLQAHALVNYLRSGNFDAYLIDYRTPLIENRMKVKPRSVSRHFIDFISGGDGSALRRKKFDQFNKRLIDPNYNTFYSVDDLVVLNKNYDAFICGSDQIWNPRITDKDTAFFLSFAESSKKRIAYAPSLGAKKIDDESFLIDNLKRIEYLSVREASNTEYIEKLSSKKCVSVIDPVFLLNKETWEKIVNQQNRIVKNKYVFYYTLFEDPILFKRALDYSNKNGLELVRLDINPLKARMRGCCSVSNMGIGPEEFLNLIKHADFVFTNSFHGTAFSLILNKTFFVRLLSGREKEKNFRIIDLLDMVELKDRIFDDYPVDGPIDWKKVEKRINPARLFSKQYLDNSLKEK